MLVIPQYLGVESLQTRTKLQQAFKSVLNCYKLEIAFKCQIQISNSFIFKDRKLKNLICGVVYKFQCGLCNEFYHSKIPRYLDITSGKYTGVAPLIGKKLKIINNIADCDHLLHCNYLTSFDNFSILAHENKKF